MTCGLMPDDRCWILSCRKIMEYPFPIFCHPSPFLPNVSRSAKQPGLETSIKSIQFRSPGRGGSVQLDCARTDQRTGKRWIGPDVGACARSAGGIVHVYMTTSGGRVSRQMARDLSVNRKGGWVVHKLSICHSEPAFHKTKFYEIGSKNGSEVPSLLKAPCFRFCFRTAANGGGAGSRPPVKTFAKLHHGSCPCRQWHYFFFSSMTARITPSSFLLEMPTITGFPSFTGKEVLNTFHLS